MAKMNLDGSDKFYDQMKTLFESEDKEWNNEGEVFEITRLDKPTTFNWHQRIFQPGIILHKKGTNVRIYVEKEKLI